MKLPRAIGSSINAVARAAVGRDWPLYATLLKHWGEIVGPEHADKTSIEKITFPKGKKAEDKWAGGKPHGCTLTILIPNGLRMEFSFLESQLLERINNLFGYAAVTSIKFNCCYRPPSPPDPEPTPKRTALQGESAWQNDIKSIESNELREALQQLGESVYQQDPPPKN